jgi:hypothetical protein
MASALNSLFGVEKDGNDYVVLGVSLKAIAGNPASRSALCTEGGASGGSFP